MKNQIKAALMTSMPPSDLQDCIFSWSVRKADFKELRDKEMSPAINRPSTAKPAPVDIDKVAAEDCKRAEGEEEGGTTRSSTLANLAPWARPACDAVVLVTTILKKIITDMTWCRFYFFRIY